MGQADLGAIVQNPVSASLPQYGLFHCGFEGNHFGVRGFTGANSGGDIFDHDAFCGRKSQNGSSLEIGLGMRLAVSNVAGGNQFPGEREARRADADFSQGAGTRGNDGPAIRGKAGQKGECTGQRDHAFEVRDFAAFDFAVLGFVIRVREIFADSRQAGTAVGAGDHLLGIESMLKSPLAPHARDCRRGVHQHSVHVEQEGGTADLSHGVPGDDFAGAVRTKLEVASLRSIMIVRIIYLLVWQRL